MMAINPSESMSFHAANCENMDTGPDQFIESFFMPDSQRGSYQDFLHCNGYTASGELRNNTDDLSIKFLEGSNNNPAFPPYQSGHQAQSQAPQAAGYPTMYSKKCMSMPAEATNGGSKTNEVRNITRSFSLIMAAFENDSLGAGPSPMMSNGNAAAQYPQKNQYPEMQYQQQQMYSNKYNEGINSNQSSGTFLPLPELQPQQQDQQHLQNIPQKRVDELLSSLRSKVGTPLKKQRSAGSAQDMMTQQGVDGYRRTTPFDNAQPTTNGGDDPSSDPSSAKNHHQNGYERNISIGTRLFRALQRTRTENVDSATARRAARQKMRVKKTTKVPSGGSNNSTTISNLPQSQSSQPHFEMEILAQRTRVIMQDKESILQENERLKAKLEMVNRLNSAQATKLEESKKK
jgi:hypothetical protein